MLMKPTLHLIDKIVKGEGAHELFHAEEILEIGKAVAKGFVTLPLNARNTAGGETVLPHF